MRGTGARGRPAPGTAQRWNSVPRLHAAAGAGGGAVGAGLQPQPDLGAAEPGGATEREVAAGDLGELAGDVQAEAGGALAAVALPALQGGLGIGEARSGIADQHDHRAVGGEHVDRERGADGGVAEDVAEQGVDGGGEVAALDGHAAGWSA